MQYNDTAGSLIGRLLRMKPSLDRSVALDLLNDRIRQIIDKRPLWAGLCKKVVVNLPAATTTGGVTLTIGSNVMTGTATNWPVTDIVNTTIPGGVSRPGSQWVTPASMSSINPNSLLYVDGTGTPEIVPVQQVRGNQFLGTFQAPHNVNCTATQSSLVSQQLLISTNNPYFTVLAVSNSTTIILDNNWAYQNLTNAGYQILQAYVTFANDVKDLLDVVDPIQPLRLKTHVPQRWLNATDPARQNSNTPVWVVDAFPNAQGQQVFELYPPSTVVYQLWALYYVQWPDMVSPGDRPPLFINPTVIYHGALADALRMKIPTPPRMEDPWYDPRAAEVYEEKFERGCGDLVNADNSKAQRDYEWDFDAFGIGGSTWNQDHAVDSSGDWMF